MFAFAIVERDSGRVLLGRDRLGIKPLYSPRTRRASGSRRRFPRCSPAAASTPASTPSPCTITCPSTPSSRRRARSCVACRKVPPASLVAIEPDGRRTTTTYWEPDFRRRAETADWSERDWEDAVLASLRTAVKRRLVADVPVGLSAVGRRRLQPHRRAARRGRPARTVDVLDRLRIGRRRAGRRVQVLRHHRRALRHRPPPDPHRHRPDAARARRRDRRDERADGQPRLRRLLSAQPGSGQARQGGAVRPGRRRGVRGVSLVSRRWPTRRRSTARWPVTGRPSSTGTPQASARSSRRTTSPRAIRAGSSSPSISPGAGAETGIDRALRLDTTVMLVDDPVKRVDNMTMAWGLEGRVPFLDHELVELAATCPPELKIAHEGKGVLKQAARQVIPADGHRPSQGVLPGARADASRGAVPRHGPRRPLCAGGQGARAVPS